MTATFLVELEIDQADTAYLMDVAQDISDALDSVGEAVISVKPWTRPTQLPATPNVFAPPAPSAPAIPRLGGLP